MKKNLLLFIFLLTMNLSTEAQVGNKKVPQFRSPFRYVIVSNSIDPSLGKGDLTRRFVEILIDKKSFSKENLTILFKLVSKRFPTPSLLYINVFTDLEDIETPEERDMPKTSDSYSTGPNEQNTATFTRYKNEMSFIMNFADGDSEEIKIK